MIKYVEPEITRQQLIDAIIKGLERSITYEEASALYWLSTCAFEERQAIAGLFSEFAKEIEKWRGTE